MRRGLVGGFLGLTVIAVACDNQIDRDATPRYYIAPDAESSGGTSGGGPLGADGATYPPDVTVATEGGPDALPTGFDPATLALSGWWRAPFAPTWVGTASVGTSATRNLTEATNPPTAGAVVNALVPADFDGTNDILTNPTPISTLLSASGWSVVALSFIDAVSAAPTAIQLELLSDSGGFWNVGTWNNPTPKFAAGQFDGATKSVETDIKLAAWNLLQARFDGTKIQVRVNGGVWVSAVANNIQVTTGTLNVGKNFQNALHYNGQVLELMLAATSLPDAAFDGIRGYVNGRYTLTL